MIDWVVTHQALIREVINGLAMVLFLVLSIMIMVFMWDAFAAHVLDRKTTRDWTHTPGVPTACALWWVFAAETYRTGAIWYLYNVGKHVHTSPYPTANIAGVGVFGESGFGTSFGYLIAGIMLVCGLQRCIYIFTPPEWKRRVWVYASIGAVVFCFIPTVVTYIGNIFDGI